MNMCVPSTLETSLRVVCLPEKEKQTTIKGRRERETCNGGERHKQEEEEEEKERGLTDEGERRREEMDLPM